MVTTSLPELPELALITDESSASTALSGALVAAVTANRRLAAGPPGAEGVRRPQHARTDVAPDKLDDWLREFHVLLVRIASKHAEITSWSVTVGTGFELTVNFASRGARNEAAPATPG